MERQGWLSRDGLVPLEHITCSICHEVYTSPRLLLCLHTYCLDCIQKHALIDSGKYVITCPTCDRKTYSDNDLSTSLPTNSYVQRLKNVFILHTGLRLQCSVCRLRSMNTEATHLCLDCSDSLCHACSEGHNYATVTSLHRVIAHNDIQKGLYTKELIQAQKPVCTEHNGQCSLFCQTCKLLICTLCILPRHKDHDLQIPEAAFDKTYAALKETLSKNSEDALKRLQTAETNATELDQSENAFKKDVISKVESLIGHIHKQRDLVLEQGKSKFEEERKRIQADISIDRSDCRRNEDVSELLLNLSLWDKHGLLEMATVLDYSIQLFNKEHLNRKMERRNGSFKLTVEMKDCTLTLGEVVTEEPLTVPTTTVSNGSEDLGSHGATENKSGDGSLHTTAMTFPEEQNTPPSSLVEAAALFTTSSASSPSGPNTSKENISEPLKKTILVLSNTFSTELHIDELQPEPGCISVPTKDVCLLLDKANGRLKVYKSNGDAVYFITLEGRCSPFEQFALPDSGKIIATIFKYSLLILTRHLILVKMVLMVKDVPEDTIPIVSNFGKDLVVGNLPGNEMRVYSEAGELLRKWSSKVRGKIVSIKFAGGDKIVVCSWPKKGHVTIESETFGNILTLRGQSKDGISWQPSDACVDVQQRIIVSDTRRNEISVFSSSGFPLTVVSTHEFNILEPSVLAVDETGNVFVSSKGGHIAVFNIK